jgi:hypothetical protein
MVDMYINPTEIKMMDGGASWGTCDPYELR